MTEHQRPLVAKGGTSEYIYRELKSDMDAKRSFNGREEEEDYLISIYCEIKTDIIVAKVLEGYIKDELDPLGYATRIIMAALLDKINNDNEFMDVDNVLLYTLIRSSIAADIDHLINIDGAEI